MTRWFHSHNLEINVQSSKAWKVIFARLIHLHSPVWILARGPLYGARQQPSHLVNDSSELSGTSEMIQRPVAFRSNRRRRPSSTKQRLLLTMQCITWVGPKLLMLLRTHIVLHLKDDFQRGNKMLSGHCNQNQMCLSDSAAVHRDTRKQSLKK